MRLLVQKYGGTSVGTPERIRQVARRVVAARRAGQDVVVVVSAMADATDELLALAAAVTPDPERHPRELDMLLTSGERISMALTAMAIRDLGEAAVSLTGTQAAIITDEAHTGARIEEVRATRVREELAAGRIVIVAGFQGVSRAREVTTLGRGGSDTTAVALAVALGAERCDIYTDVTGVFTADPRRVPDAELIAEIGYEEMVELASAGAQVLHPRAVEIGARYGLPIRVRSALRPDDHPGTLITRRVRTMEQLALTGLAAKSGYARLVLRGLPATMAATARVLSAFAAAGVSVDMAGHADVPAGHRQLQLTVREADLERAEDVAAKLLEALAGATVEVKTGLTRVTLVGSGMNGVPGVFARAFEALIAAGVEVYALSTSASSFSLLVPADAEDRTLQALHAAFAPARERA
ncbi:MAG: aspartate kinase [Gemmatimonadetes bacterium]|nr:aspartate kinase [Gemmatimonadota bacterium]